MRPIYRALLSGVGGGGGGGGGGFVNADTAPPALGGGTGCRLYCAAHHGLYTDAGTTLATAANDPIYRWKDYSGSNNHMDQGTLSGRPLAGSSAQLKFGGHVIGPPYSTTVSGVTDGEIFLLLKLDSDPQVGGGAGGLWYFGGGDVGVYSSPTIFEGTGTTGRYSFADPGGLTSWHVYSVRTDGSNWEALKNNVSLDARTGNTPSWGAFQPVLGVTIGTTLFLYGEVAAIAFYGGVRSSGERSSIVSALLAQSPP